MKRRMQHAPVFLMSGEFGITVILYVNNPNFFPQGQIWGCKTTLYGVK
jgi:hypothetical protein